MYHDREKCPGFIDWAKEGVMKDEGGNHLIKPPMFPPILKEFSRKLWRSKVFSLFGLYPGRKKNFFNVYF